MHRGRPKTRLVLSDEEREALQAMEMQSDTQAGLAVRARIVLGCADGLDNKVVAERNQVTPHTVAKWRARFIQCGVSGLSDAQRTGAPRSISDSIAATIIAEKQAAPQSGTSIRRIARRANVSASSVVRILKSADRQASRDRAGSTPAAADTSQRTGSPERAVKELRKKPQQVRDLPSEAQVPAISDPLADLSFAFQMAPVGLLVTRQRVIVSCNQAFSEMFGYSAHDLAGKSVEYLYPTRDEFQHVGKRAMVVMQQHGFYSDDRIMRKIDGSFFWCHVSGRSFNRDDPFAAATWCFEDLSKVRPVTTKLTPREREVAQFLVTGKSSKQIARDLHISHRTVEAHRVRLMRKYAVATVGELIAKLIGRG
ncbi:LuxR family transcriptional regulator [Burkholderia pseudomultivorans]|uniref:LuxR family transcriptional regulator n=2 Tax=Burkholderia pseudomultivorans TaxID=1207504 RepID=A0A132EXP8_9BURK|nr:LuxR family transcriptional regulator [Burkholderia pseudomultivorans]